MNEIIVATGSDKDFKQYAATHAILEVMGLEEAFIVGEDVDSGVTKQPRGIGVAFTGAENRAKAIREACPDADYAVGIEDGIYFVNREVYVFSAAAISIQKEPGYACKIGTSMPFKLDSGLMTFLTSEIELSEAVFQYFKGKYPIDYIKEKGAQYFFTDPHVERVDMMIEAVKTAMKNEVQIKASEL